MSPVAQSLSLWPLSASTSAISHAALTTGRAIVWSKPIRPSNPTTQHPPSPLVVALKTPFITLFCTMSIFYADSIISRLRTILTTKRIPLIVSQVDDAGGFRLVVDDTTFDSPGTSGFVRVRRTGVSALPVELLALIFLCLRDIYLEEAPIDFLPLSATVIHYRSSWLVVTCVSRTWRKVAHDCQSLWDSVLITKKGDLEERLRLAGGIIPLAVSCIDVLAPDVDWTRGTVQKTVEDTLPRLRHLALRGPDSWLANATGEHSAPVLENLSLCCSATAAGALSDLFIHGSFPILQALSLYNYTVELPCGILCSTLRFLDVKCPAGVPRPTRNALFACLRAMRSLEVLSLDRILSGGRPTNDSITLLDLPRLRTISVSDWTFEVAPFIELLSFPSETRIWLNCLADPLPLAHIPITDAISRSLGSRMLACEGQVAPFAAFTAECVSNHDSTGRFKYACHIHAWRVPLNLVSPFGYMLSKAEFAAFPPDLSLAFAACCPFDVSDLCREIPLGDVRSLGLSCASCVEAEIPAFIKDMTTQLFPDTRVLGIMDRRLLSWMPSYLAVKTRSENDLVSTRNKVTRSRPILPELRQLILPDLSAPMDAFDLSDFVDTMTSTFNKRKLFGGASVTITMNCDGKFTEADHSRLRRAAGRLQCITCTDATA